MIKIKRCLRLSHSLSPLPLLDSLASREVLCASASVCFGGASLFFSPSLCGIVTSCVNIICLSLRLSESFARTQSLSQMEMEARSIQKSDIAQQEV